MATFDTPGYAAYPEGQEWSEWLPFPRSSNIAAARYKIGTPAGLGVWQVMFGGKVKEPTAKRPNGGMTPLSCYEYGPSAILTDDLYWRWWNQYVAGGSAGIFLDLHVKRQGVTARQQWTQGA